MTISCVDDDAPVSAGADESRVVAIGRRRLTVKPRTVGGCADPVTLEPPEEGCLRIEAQAPGEHSCAFCVQPAATRLLGMPAGPSRPKDEADPSVLAERGPRVDVAPR